MLFIFVCELLIQKFVLTLLYKLVPALIYLRSEDMVEIPQFDDGEIPCHSCCIHGPMATEAD